MVPEGATLGRERFGELSYQLFYRLVGGREQRRRHVDDERFAVLSLITSPIGAGALESSRIFRLTVIFITLPSAAVRFNSPSPGSGIWHRNVRAKSRAALGGNMPIQGILSTQRVYQTSEGQSRSISKFIRDPDFLVACALAAAGLILSFGLQLFFSLSPETWTSFADCL